jgi:hypothetical protein
VNKFTCTPVISTEQVDREILNLNVEIQSCNHNGSIFKWNAKHNGEDIVANLCEDCGRTWGTKK